MDKTSITLGLRIGRILAGQRRKRVPVAYLYGEDQVRLPPLPDIDFPYMAIRQFTDNGTYWLYASEKEIYQRSVIYQYDYAVEAPYAYYGVENGEWKLYGTEDILALSVPLYNTLFVWANHKIVLNDGSTLLEASEPVPVYE